MTMLLLMMMMTMLRRPLLLMLPMHVTMMLLMLLLLPLLLVLLVLLVLMYVFISGLRLPVVWHLAPEPLERCDVVCGVVCGVSAVVFVHADADAPTAIDSSDAMQMACWSSLTEAYIAQPDLHANSMTHRMHCQ